MLELTTELLEVHDALYVMRTTVDPDFTDKAWRPSLPGDKITIKDSDMIQGEISDILWPALSRQLMPRDGDN
jgi:intracellular multiplication protein IcmB